ncbi:putative penicillinase repressor [Microtetraspora sp. NBRC 16547]|nr:putative penicillinase repressor [Microtetraspora sp. NBRC 16547]
MLEDEVLATLWAASGPMSPADVQAELGGSLAYTTVMTTLARLHRKGLATRERAGRGFVYAPTVDEASHTADAMRDLLVRRSDRAAVLAEFVSRLSPDEEQVLQRLLREVDG